MIPSNPTSVFNFPENAVSIAKIVGKSDHREVFSASFVNNNSEHFAFFNKDANGNVVSFVIVNELRIFDRDVAEIVRTWTLDSLQNKGYISALLKFIQDFTKLSIISDKEQTPTARDFWKNVERKFNVQMMDMETGNLYGVDDTQVYSKTDPEKYRLFIESYEFVVGVGKIPNKQKSLKEWTDPTLIPYVYFEDGDV